MSRAVFRSPMPVGAHDLFEWHTRPGAFERLVPPWQDVRVVDRVGGIEPGSRLYLRIAAGPARIRWVAEHTAVVEGREFTDLQRHGPFAQWRHRHRFLDGDAPGTGAVLSDEIDYRLPLEPVSRWVAGRAVRRDLERMFAFRHERTRRDLMRHAEDASRQLRVAVTGSTGMIGSALCAFLTTGGHAVVRLVRRPARSRIDGTTEVRWDPASGRLDPTALEGVDAVVHLAGAPVAEGRWTEDRRREIRRSRIEGTALIARALAQSGGRDTALVAASGIGYYGDRTDEVDEDSASGSGFLAATAREWEAACGTAAAAGVRVVQLRFGTVIGARGGMLRRLLPIYRLGLGGPLGDGSQPLSWISLDDAIGLIRRCLVDPSIEGPINAVAPDPISQRRFARALGSAVSRPAVIRAPRWLVRGLTGEMGTALALGGAPVRSRRLAAIGFVHQDGDLDEALAMELGGRRRPSE